MVEETYEKNGRLPIIFICHSMGSPMTLYFLNNQTQQWKDKYIRAMVTMAGVWGGTVRAMKVFAVGKIESEKYVFPDYLYFLLLQAITWAPGS